MYLSEIHRQTSRSTEENTYHIHDKNNGQIREKGNDDDVNSSRLTKKCIVFCICFLISMATTNKPQKHRIGYNGIITIRDKIEQDYQNITNFHLFLVIIISSDFYFKRGENALLQRAL